MKKSFTVNINGRIYNIDEDAYALLNDYLGQLRATFPGDDGCEIVTDIEARMAELFDERLGSGSQVIEIEDVNRVISIMGRPEDLGGDAGEGDDAACNHTAKPTPPPFTAEERPRHRLYRNIDNKMLGGVISGVAAYFGFDPNPLRLLMIILTVCTAFWPCFVIYLIAWTVIPPADTPRRRLELRGEEVSVEAVGRGVLTADRPDRQQQGGGGSGFAGFLNTVAKCFMGLVGLVSGAAGVGMAIGLLCITGVMIAMPFSGGISSVMADNVPGGHSFVALVCGALCCLMILLPCVALFWLALSVVFGVKGCSTGTIIAAAIIEALLFIAVIVLGIVIGSGVPGCQW